MVTETYTYLVRTEGHTQARITVVVSNGFGDMVEYSSPGIIIRWSNFLGNERLTMILYAGETRKIIRLQSKELIEQFLDFIQEVLSRGEVYEEVTRSG